jgi:aspartate aminotransferase-like enzyme
MVSTVYQLREALAMLAEEGLHSAWARHAAMAADLHRGLADLGLELFVANPAWRLPTVTTVKVPEGVVWSDVTGYIMKKYNLEISGGLGPTVGKVRIRSFSWVGDAVQHCTSPFLFIESLISHGFVYAEHRLKLYR